MPQELTLRLLPLEVMQDAAVQRAIGTALGVAANRVTGFVRLRQSLDARGKQVSYQLGVRAYVDENFIPPDIPQLAFPNVQYAKSVHIVGLGPAGLFAALRLLELGYKPIVLERGKCVRERRRDLAQLTRQGIVNPESNYCFGEGGAGTYSDGKLYTRATKRGNLQRVLGLLCAHGAPAEILYEAHPHIGTNKLPQIVERLTQTICQHGGEVHFEAKLTGITVTSGQLTALQLANGSSLACEALILATGHSARDVYHLLHNSGIALEAKPFALGLRLEHPQALINQLLYRQQDTTLLPPAAYSLACQAGGRGVFSFCMCPGGIIAPAATGPEEVVVNGWSPSRRNNAFANTGLVATVGPQDFTPYQAEGPLAGLAFQQEVEKQAWLAGGGLLTAPAQRLTDFLARRTSTSLPTCSYLPGISPAALHTLLPPSLTEALRQGLIEFGRKLPGYITPDAVLVGVESRTSAPVRIPRDKLTLQHPQVSGLFPCAEGAGYAGGIMSAAWDGEHCADAVAAHLGKAVAPTAS